MGTRRWFLYDGDCAFCSACARLINRYLPTDARVVPWQFTDLAALGITAEECERAVQWVALDPANPSGAREAAEGPAAFAALLGRGGALARLLGRMLATRPMLAAAGPVYDFSTTASSIPCRATCCHPPSATAHVTRVTSPKINTTSPETNR